MYILPHLGTGGLAKELNTLCILELWANRYKRDTITEQ